jgi:uncharacterized protein YndB with AHSA1/START domain
LFGNFYVTYICVTFMLPVMQKEIKQTWYFKQSPEEIWEYLTKPKLLSQWLMDNNIKPIVGHKFQFTFTPKPDSKYEGVVNCEVLEAIPFTKLSYSWNGSTKDKRNFTSIVEWTLIPKEKGTELQLLHKGLNMPEDILNHTSGWDACLKRFEEKINSASK